MSLKGGYKILDLSLNPTYDEIAKVLDTEKTILVSGLVVSGELQKDVFASVEEVEGVYTLKTPDKIITIDDTNGVVVSENKNPSIAIFKKYGDMTKTTSEGVTTWTINAPTQFVANDQIILRGLFSIRGDYHAVIFTGRNTNLAILGQSGNQEYTISRRTDTTNPYISISYEGTDDNGSLWLLSVE